MDNNYYVCIFNDMVPQTKFCFAISLLHLHVHINKTTNTNTMHGIQSTGQYK